VNRKQAVLRWLLERGDAGVSTGEITSTSYCGFYLAASWRVRVVEWRKILLAARGQGDDGGEPNVAEPAGSWGGPRETRWYLRREFLAIAEKILAAGAGVTAKATATAPATPPVYDPAFEDDGRGEPFPWNDDAPKVERKEADRG